MIIRRFQYVIALPLLLLITAGCGKDPSVTDSALATFSTGKVSKGDLRLAERFLAEDDARVYRRQKMSRKEILSELARWIAIRRIVSQTDLSGIQQDPLLREQARQAQRRWVLDQWKETCYGFPEELPGEEEMARESSEEEIQLPPRLNLAHIYLQAETPKEEEEARRKLNRWRTEIKDIDQFEAYAREHSDSQSARKGGRLGKIRPGWLPKEAEELLFTLPEGSISEPIKLRGGLHIFYVIQKLPPRTMPRKKRAARLFAGKKAEAIGRCHARRLALVKDRFQPDAGGDGSDLVIGEWRIPGSILRDFYGQPGQDPQSIRQRLFENEVLFQTAMTSSWMDADRRTHAENIKLDVFVRAAIGQMARERYAEPSREALRAEYDGSPNRYRSMLKMKVSSLKTQVPPETDPLAFLNALSEIAQELRSKKVSWADVCSRLQAACEVQHLPSLEALDLLSHIPPPVFESIKKLPAGTVTKPIQDKADFYVLEIHEAEPSRRLTFEEAIERVKRKIENDRRQAVIKEIVVELLQVHHFQFTKAWETFQPKETKGNAT